MSGDLAQRHRLPLGGPFETGVAFLLFVGVMLTVPTVWRPNLFEVLATGQDPASGWVINRDTCLRVLVPDPAQAARPLGGPCLPYFANQIIPSNGARLDVLLVLGGICLLSLTQYWLAPVWRIRQRRLQRIQQIGSTAMLAEIDRAVDVALPGSSAKVHFWVDILNPSVGGVAFGHMFRKHVVLSRGMLGLFEQDRALFRAVVMHELAHIRNHDVSVTAITVAMWRSFLILIIVPGLADAGFGIATGVMTVESVAGLAITSGPTLAWVMAAQLVGLAWLARLARRAVLQSRELYADARALTWQPESALQHLLADDERGRASSASHRGTHPHLAMRKATAAGVRLLMRQGFAFTFTLGAFYSMAWDSMMSPSGGFLRGGINYASAVFLVLMAFALTSYAPRAASYANPADLLPGRLGLSAGLAIGWALMPSRLTDHAIAPFPVALQIVSLLLLAGAGWLLMMWAEWVARPWVSNPHELANAQFVPVPIFIIGLGLFAFSHTMYDIHLVTIATHAAVARTDMPAFVQALLVAQWRLDVHASNRLFLVLFMIVPLACASVRWWDVGQSPVRRRKRHHPLAAFVARIALTMFRIGTAIWRQAGGVNSVWQSPRPKHARLLATLVAPTAALVAAAWSGAVDRGLLDTGPAIPALIALGSAIAAGVAAATAICARAAPIPRAMLAALGGGALYLMSVLIVAPGALSPSLAFARSLEAATLSALAATALRHLARKQKQPLLSAERARDPDDV